MRLSAVSGQQSATAVHSEPFCCHSERFEGAESPRRRCRLWQSRRESSLRIQQPTPRCPHPSYLILHPCRAGFTLIELLTVIAIIAILAAITVGGAKYAMTKSATSRAQAEIAAMETALEHYKNENGVYPRSTVTRVTDLVSGNSGTIEISNSGSLYTALAVGNKIYFTFKPDQIRATTVNGVPVTHIIDPFGHPYNYYNNPGAPDQVNAVTYDLWSYGPAGTNEPPDRIVNNITNWKR
jgi:prepilin-type N-terminal cleavage/methylation domain-containing protein